MSATLRLRSRVREALVCPYCRDAVERRGTVACARSACGALYHRECWDECVTSYGGCAVFGCSGRKSREVTRVGYALRLFRLVLAALVFPPRLVEAIRSEEHATARRSIGRRALDYAKLINPRTADGWHAVVCVFLYLCALPFMLALGAFTLFGIVSLAQSAGSQDAGGIAIVAGIFLVPLTIAVAIFSPVPIGFVLALGFYAMKFAASVLAAEVSALARVDAPENTVLGRLRAGAGKKCDH